MMRQQQQHLRRGIHPSSFRASSVTMKLLLVLLLSFVVLQPIHGQRSAMNMATTTKLDKNARGGSSKVKKRQLQEGKKMNPIKMLPKLLQRRQKQTSEDDSTTTSPTLKWYRKKSKRLPPPEWTIGTSLFILYLILMHYIWLTSRKNPNDPAKQKVAILGRKLSSSPPPHVWEDDEISIKEDGAVTQKSGLESIDLAFEGIQLEMSTTKKKKKISRLLLDGSIHGRAKPGRMLAVMGPSGAGKSVFVHALAGRLKDSKKLSLVGQRYINSHIVEGDSLLPAAFVEQDVNFFPHMTVRETLEFRVSLKLGSLITTAQRDKIVENLMKQLGLLKSADTIVGDTKIRGLSGGERKRLSIAVEMISSPSLIFLDEPTSGLDSSAAANLVERLRDLANEGKTVVAVIHQPSQHVFSMFDDLLLLSEGQQMYFGPIEDVRSYMEKQGYKPEKEVGTAEYVLECISKVPRSDETESEAHDRVMALAAHAKKEQKVDLGLTHNGDDDVDKSEHYAVVAARHGPRASIFKQFGLLMKRAGREALRGKGVVLLKTIQQVTVSLIYGGIYKLGTNQASIQDRYGLISLTAIGSANMAIASSIRAFPKEKAIVANEIASKMYRTLPYFVGKAISELPLVAFYNGIFMTMLYKLTGMNPAPGKLRQFLGVVMMHGLAAESLGLAIGAVSPNSDIALGIFPAVLVLNIIFDGRNISVENTPKYLRWIAKIGLIRWGFEGLSLVEFTGLKFDTGGPRRGPVAKTGQEALERLGLGERTLGTVFKAQLALTAVCWGLSFIGMTLTRQKFLVMKPPKP